MQSIMKAETAATKPLFSKLINLKLTVALLFSLLSSFFCFSQRQHYVLNLPQILCHKTTELGPDEVYFIVTWRTSFGSTGTQRLVQSHWDMNDGDHDERLLRLGDIYGFDLADGESIDFVVTVMEMDGGTLESIAEIGKRTLANLPTTEALIPSGRIDALQWVGRTFNIQDTDDWIG